MGGDDRHSPHPLDPMLRDAVSKTPAKARRLAREAAGLAPGCEAPSDESIRALVLAYPAAPKLREYLIARYGAIPAWAESYLTRTQREAAARKRPTRTEEKRRKPGTSAEIRARVFERDGHRCVVCDATRALTLDHWIPRSRGGPHSLANCRTMCWRCNHMKGDMMPEAFLTMDGAPGSRERRMGLL